jgi:predicted transcriptional regulator
LHLVGKKRNRLGIIASILDAAEFGSCKTRIMMNANLSFRLLNKYLDLVLSLNLLKASANTYFLTEKGTIFLKKYRQVYSNYVNAKEQFEALTKEYLVY